MDKMKKLIEDRLDVRYVVENVHYSRSNRRKMSNSIQDINDIDDLRQVLLIAHGVRARLRRWAVCRDIDPHIDRIRKDIDPYIAVRAAPVAGARADPVECATRPALVARAQITGDDNGHLAIDCHKSGLNSMLACPTEAAAAGDGVASVAEHIRPIRLVSIVSHDADRSITTEVAKGVFDDLKRNYAAAALVSVSSASTRGGGGCIDILTRMYNEVNPAYNADSLWNKKRLMQEIRNFLENKRSGLSVVMTAPAGCPHRPCLLDPWSSSDSETSTLLRLPGWLHSPSAPCKLSSLCITVQALEQNDLDMLGKCGALRFLGLQVEGDTKKGFNITVSGGAFKRLVDFKFASRARSRDRTQAARAQGVELEGGPGPAAPREPVLKFEEGVMPELETLSLSVHVPVGDSVDLGLQHLASLKTAHIRIDCSDATVWEVSKAEAALWVAANQDRREPVTLDFPRDFETQMKNDCDTHAEIGLWGPEEGGEGYNKDGDDERPHRLENVTVWTGKVVDALEYSYLDCSGNLRSMDRNDARWGSRGGVRYKFKLGPEEFLERVSGTIGRYQHGSEVLTIITSLTFVTNLCQHGPLGVERGHHFHIPRQGDGRITGFFLRAGKFVDAIGVYICAGPHCVSSVTDLLTNTSS
ncbi:uncharacterized protein LOC119292972 [Triticum dicoccoides]|uniref:uncharacterized protein LOC119292972 n=1 Tax=Triticum dicoccoides TaxID=85692 RepID=UPI00188E7E6D|nr:uncharacterized protein LOC119292972 [Triticum dicoccoides]